MKRFLGLWVLSLLISCSSESQNKATTTISASEKTTWESFQKIPQSASLKLTTNDEPGEKLILCIRVVDKTKKTPLEDQKVLLYQTGNDGEYRPEVAGNERTARIKGVGFTDNKGRLYIETILPGSYATQGDGRHIHTQVFGAKPEAYDLHFKQYTGAKMRRFIENRDQFFLIDLKYTEDNQLIGFVTIEVKNPA